MTLINKKGKRKYEKIRNDKVILENNKYAKQI